MEKGLFIDHGSGVIIEGETTELEIISRCTKESPIGGNRKGTGKEIHPTLEDNVMVSAGAKVLDLFYHWEKIPRSRGESVVLKRYRRTVRS